MKRFALLMIIAAALCVFNLPARAQSSGQRVAFAKGRTSANVKGTIKNAVSKFYVVRAKAGQLISTSVVSANSGIMIVGINGPDGEIEGAGATGEWSGQIPADGDYTIEIGIADGKPNGAFTLKIAIK